MQKKPQANVSVVVANYNNARFLGAFLQSVRESSVHPRELIVVDDGSTDQSREILLSCDGLPFLKTIFFDRNQGFTSALNAGLEAGTSKYIMRADPDDLLMPTRIEKQIAFLEKHPYIDMLGCNAKYYSESLKRFINKTNFPTKHASIVKRYRSGEHGLLHATVAGKTEVYQSYRYQHLTPGEDYELFAKMVKDGRGFANLKEALYIIRVHPHSATSSLTLEAIERTFYFRDRLFGTKTSKRKIRSYYQHIKHYRKFQLAGSPTAKMCHLLLAMAHSPKKLLRRVTQ